MSLKEELQDAVYNGKTDAECLALLTTKNIPAKQSISNQDMKNYLVAVGKLRGIKEGTTDSAKDAWLAVNEIPSFDMSNPAYEASLTANLDGLIADGLLANEDKTFLLSMGDKMISRAEELGLGSVQLRNIKNGRA